MRIKCTNCTAQYEVSDDVIPEEGREVQCSNCGTTWFQSKHPEAEDAIQPTATAEASNDTDTSAAPAQRPNPDPSENRRPARPAREMANSAPEQQFERKTAVEPAVASILQEEAQRESRIRAAETNLDADAAISRQMEDLSSPGSRDLLPDVEAINSTFRSGGAAAAAAGGAAVAASGRKRGGFFRGFVFIVLLVAIAAAVYVFAPQISEQVPQAKPYLDTYVATVDEWRLKLEDAVRQYLPQPESTNAPEADPAAQPDTTATEAEPEAAPSE